MLRQDEANVMAQGTGVAGTITAFGLDLAGYSSGKSGFARADRKPGKEIQITIYRDNLFCRQLMGREPLADTANHEQLVVEACLGRGVLLVDVPIDLQGLPNVSPVHFAWELTRRPVDFALSALAPLADRIGAPFARFAHCLAEIHQDTDPLGRVLWETYPAASLRLLHLKSTGYKGKSAVLGADEWRPDRPGHQPLAALLNRLDWFSEEEGLRLTDDEFDAALCALTGVADPEARVEADRLEQVIRYYLTTKTEKAHDAHIRATPPRGYVLMQLPPMEPVRLHVKRIRTLDETRQEVAR